MLDAGQATQSKPEFQPRAYRYRLELEKDEVCVWGLRSLWVKVLHRLTEDALGKGCTPAERNDARNMIGHWPSKDFREICELAGFDPDYVHGALTREIARLIEAKR